ncbi:hypothetical protein MYX77_00885 [Acidobacteriia bacterium AH_259_A11_L15]|nr:hypothetical protein [Acidobacteriia bacterium AH_259_A11_L15]
MHYWQVTQVTGLQPNRLYTATLMRGTQKLASAKFCTLPESLPHLGDSPFNVLLGSCFHLDNDKQGDAGFSFDKLPTGDRPHVKILCGDQVYLDQPTLRIFPDDSLKLARIFLEKYVKSWSQSDAPSVRGYARILKEGANYFASDDHEFWNNYPNWTTLVPNSWTQGGRDRWAGPARELYKIFQNSDPAKRPPRFDVPPLSFLVADCRYNREPGDSEFLSAVQLLRLNDWIDNLNSRKWCGFLCLGQPIFEHPASWFARRFADRSLPDYSQYRDLVKILAKLRQPLTILTGDVHFGRVARCQQLNRSDLFEIISSPLSLVNPLVGGKAKHPPATYPAEAIPGTSRVGIDVVKTLDGDLAMTPVEHFLTINFWSKGPSVRLRLKYWPVRTKGEAPKPIHKTLVDMVRRP